jgi:cobalt-zinc-cadmium efflux system outer membrane protein
MRPIVCLALAAASCASTERAPPARSTASQAVEPPAPEVRTVDDVSSAERLDVRRVVALALERAPSLREAAGSQEAAAGRADQAGLWPNPRLSLEARDVPRHPVAMSRGGRWATLSQPLALGGRLGAAADAAEAELAAAREDQDRTRRSVVADVLRAGADLAAAEESIALRRESAAVADELLGAARRAAEAGAAPADVAVLEVEAESARAEMRRAEQERAAALGALRAAVGGAAPRLAHVEWPAEDIPSDLGLDAGDVPPQLAAAMRRVEAAQFRLAEAKSARVPDVEAFVAYGRVGETDDEQVEAGVMIPLPVFDSGGGRVRERAAELRVARAAEDRVRAELAARRAAAVAETDAARQDLAGRRDRAVPAAERLAARTAAAFADGVRSSNDVVLARRTLALARLGLVEARRALRRAQADLLELGASPEAAR